MVWVVNAKPQPLYPRERPGTHCIGGWLGGPQGRSGRVRKILPTPGFDPRTVQPVASRYTDWAIPAHACSFDEIKLSELTFYLSCVTIEAKRPQIWRH